MKKSKTFFACAMLVAFASCSNDNVLSQSGAEDTPIRIQANVGAVTTKAASNIQGTQFDANEYINVYLFEKTGGTGTQTQYGNSGLVVFKTTDASGHMDPQSPYNNLYYPTNGQPVLAYAFYPALSTDQGYDIKNDVNSFTVANNQTDDGGYKKSDLMFAKQVETAKKDNPIKLTFVHQLTKVKVKLVPGGGVSSVNGATIKMLNVNKTIALTMPTSDYSQEINLGATSDNVNTTGIEFGTVDVDNGNAIIIVPQNITQNEQVLFEVTYNGAKYNYKLPNSGTLNFAAKTEYTYTLKLTSGGLTVESTKISPWIDGGNTDGDATFD